MGRDSERGARSRGEAPPTVPAGGQAEIETFSDDVWTSPRRPAVLRVVLCDGRGGVAFAGYAVRIAP